ncbi:helix-turn-helix transcriptional regulator [Sphingobacterium siyangense]|uniref:helix-turn-helix transcriptional regulator n=1 Tax=Sphingobacterium siyangense TaxID=459529 RepID=UPI002FDD0AB0
MMSKFSNSSLSAIIVYLFFLVQSTYAQHIDHDLLIMEISNLNDRNQNEKSIRRLEEIINDHKSTAYDCYQAYILKSLTYKNLYNYTGALSNLDSAYNAGQKSTHKEETETRVLIERLFIYFDLKKNDEFETLLKQVKKENLKYINKETLAFFECILGHVEMRKKNLSAADQYFDKAIDLLQQENPKHLPIVYKVKVELYNLMGKKSEAMKAFENGMDYAEKFKIDLYKITMLETIIYYYIANEDYKNAYLAQNQVSLERRKYDAANRSGKLTALEKELVQQRSSLELNSKKRMELLYACIIGLLCVLVFVLYKLYRSNNQRRRLMEKEIENMRQKLESYVQPIDETPANNFYSNIEKYNLTPRHKEIIDLIRHGKTNKEIGNTLFISENTVKYHLKTIYEILEIDSRNALIK